MNRKAIFDRVKAMLGRGFTAVEVQQLDAAIDSAMKPDAPSAPESRFVPGSVSPAGIALIKQFEGCAKRLPDGRYAAYPDPGTGGAPWTIGWGSTADEQGNPIQHGMIWTQTRADARFRQHLAQFEGEVNQLLGDAPTTQGQFDALVSFAYNVGVANLAKSTLLKRHLAGSFGAAADQFALWNKAAGRVMPGLTRRRAAEAALYRSGS